MLPFPSPSSSFLPKDSSGTDFVNDEPPPSPVQELYSSTDDLDSESNRRNSEVLESVSGNKNVKDSIKPKRPDSEPSTPSSAHSIHSISGVPPPKSPRPSLTNISRRLSMLSSISVIYNSPSYVCSPSIIIRDYAFPSNEDPRFWGKGVVAELSSSPASSSLSSSSTETPHVQTNFAEQVMPEPMPITRGLYRLLYTFESEGPEELGVTEGEVILVLGEVCEGWVLGRRREKRENVLQLDEQNESAPSEEPGQEGLVPTNYIEWVASAPEEEEESDVRELHISSNQPSKGDVGEDDTK